MAQTQKIFIDISAFIAFIDRADLNHRKSVDVFEKIGTNGYLVFTSSPVVYTTYLRIDRDISPIVANDFLQAILESNIEIIYPAKADLLAALRYCKANPTRLASISEVTSAVFMGNRSIRHVLTFDFWHNTLGTSTLPLLQV